MKRTALVHNIAVFDEEAMAEMFVDNMKLTFSPYPLGVRSRSAFDGCSGIEHTTALGVGFDADVKLVWRGDGPVLQWTYEDVVFQQRLGPTRRGPMSGLTMTVDMNPIRALRRSIGMEACRFPQPRGADNFI